MSDVEIRRLNEKGLEKYAMDVWGHQPNGEPPYDILYDDEYTEVVIFSNGNPRNIDADATFTSGREMVELLDSSFMNKVELNDVIGDDGMWAWFSLLFYGCLRKGEPGNWKRASLVRFIPSGAGFRYYRHLVSARYAVWKTHGEDGMIFLHSPANNWSDIPEQLLSVSLITSSPTIIKTINALYYDESKPNGLKKGAGGKNEGTSRRFREVFWQLYETYDLRTMESAEILELLPNEFNRFQPELEGDVR